MKRSLVIALLVGFILGVASQHQSAKVIRDNVVGPAVAANNPGNINGAIDVLQDDLHRHEVMIEQLRRGHSNATRGFIALGACASNGAYNAPGMLYQCVSDYWAMRWGTSRVDDSCVRYVFTHGTPRDVGRLLHSGQASC